MTHSCRSTSRTRSSYLPDMPFALWMFIATICLGLVGGLDAQELIGTFNSGFGQALGDFALILLPAFTLAAAIERLRATPAEGYAAAVSPIAGAGMICPDTAYAALSPIAGRKKLNVAFGSYAGFKLLYPAGPLIVATGLGVEQASLAFYGLVLLIPVWLSAFLWVRLIGVVPVNSNAISEITPMDPAALRSLFPFALVAALLFVGAVADFSGMSMFDFFTQPKGALMAAAFLAILDTPAPERRACLDSAISRTGSLLLVIGAASALGGMLTHLLPLGDLFPTNSGIMGIIGLFALTALFKLAQGSSMATFAAVAPVAAPIVAGFEMSSVAAVFAICLGSFVAILPNDSFYWLIRRDALEDVASDGRVVWMLAGGALIQALTGLALVVLAAVIGII